MAMAVDGLFLQRLKSSLLVSALAEEVTQLLKCLLTTKLKESLAIQIAGYSDYYLGGYLDAAPACGESSPSL